MGILLGFLPFLAFAVLNGPLGATKALLIGAAVSGVLGVRSRMKGQSLKILEMGTLVLFVAVAIYSATATVSVLGVRLAVDTGLLVIVLASMAVRRPFTLQYAREQVPPELWDRPAFARANYLISAGWAVALLVIVGAEALLVYAPALPRAVGFGLVGASMLGAGLFTAWQVKNAGAEGVPVAAVSR